MGKLAAVVLIVLVFPGVASANIWPTAAVQTAIQTADAHWPTSPCQGREQITWVAVIEVTTDEQTAGLAFPDTCDVTIAWGSFKHHRAPALLCTILEHEFGHLAGVGHSDNQLSVMYAMPWVYAPDCTAALPLGHYAHGNVCRRRQHGRAWNACWALID